MAVLASVSKLRALAVARDPRDYALGSSEYLSK